jgi:hypothetical protein
MFKIRRRTKRIFVYNSWSINGGWYAYATFIDLMFFGIKIFNLYWYYISYRGIFTNLKGKGHKFYK